MWPDIEDDAFLAQRVLLPEKTNESSWILKSPISPLTAAALQMIICKRPAPPDDHLQEVDVVPPDHHLQEAGLFGSPFAKAGPLFWKPQIGHEKCIFETPHNEIKCVLSAKESNFNGKKIKISHLLTVRAKVADPPPPLAVSLIVKYPGFFYASPYEIW